MNSYVLQLGTTSVTFSTKFGSLGSINGQFNNPSGVAFDTAGKLYVADTNNSRIQIFQFTSGSVAPTHVRTWGSYGSSNGTLNSPVSVAVNAFRHVIVGCLNGVQVFNEFGIFITKFPGELVTGDTSAAPYVAVDNVGKVVVANRGNDRIHLFSSGGTPITTFGSSGSGDGQFNQPSGIAVDVYGKIFITDRQNHRFQLLNNTALVDGAYKTGTDGGPT
jgi:tripartite motif-containing protein 71